MTGYLLGDSHLARIVHDLPRLGADVVNLASGGAVVDDLALQLTAIAPSSAASLVLSIGTNDADPTRGRPLAEFRERLVEVVGSRPSARWVFVASPGCVGDRITSGWTAAGIAAYAAAAASVVRDAGGRVIPTHSVLAAAGDTAFDPDGFHLSGTGYGLLVPAVRDALGSPA